MRVLTQQTQCTVSCIVWFLLTWWLWLLIWVLVKNGLDGVWWQRLAVCCCTRSLCLLLISCELRMGLVGKGLPKIVKEAALGCPCKPKEAAVTQNGKALESPFSTFFQRLFLAHGDSWYHLLGFFSPSTLLKYHVRKLGESTQLFLALVLLCKTIWWKCLEC